MSIHRHICKYSESVLLQLRNLLLLVSQEQYVAKYPVLCQSTSRVLYTDSAIGSHVRHIYDHYEKVFAATIAGPGHLLSYDVRTRGTEVESDVAAGILENEVLVNRLQQICADDHVLNREVIINHVIDGSGTEISLPSTLGRELVFVSHHAIHHVATVKSLMATHCSGLNLVDLGGDIGKAPSTVNLDNQVQASR
jgi:hypothetical protein